MGPTLQALLYMGLLQPSCATVGPSPWAAAPAQGCSCEGIYCCPWALPWLYGEIHGFHAVPVGCRGTVCSSMGLSWAAGNFCSVPGAPPALNLVDAGLLLIFSHSSLLLTVSAQHFFFHKSFPSDAAVNLIVFRDWSLLEPAGTGSVQHKGIPVSSHRGYPHRLFLLLLKP